jgi:hypothetical protein
LELGFYPFAFAKVGSRLIVGGFGSQPAPPQTFPRAYDNIVGWDVLDISPLPTGVGGGLNGWVSAMAARVESATTTSLAVGGFFTGTSGLPSTSVSNVALWTENTTNMTGNWSAMGSGFNNEVLAMGLFRGQFVAGGFFTASGTTTVNGIARFNGTAWTALTSGLSQGTGAGRAQAFVTRVAGTISNPQHQLIVGGNFTAAGGVSAKNVAIYFENTVNHPLNGWLTLGNGFNASVSSLVIHNGAIYAGGNFTLSGDGVTPLGHIARWTGTTWVQVGGGFSSPVNALLSHGGSLFALVGGANPQLMKWNGTTWSALNPGFQSADGLNNVFAMSVFHDEIHVGGFFDAVNSGTTASPGWARYLETGSPWIAQQPASQSVGCGNNATLSVQAAVGYTDLTFVWQRDDVPLTNGPTGSGSSISGANSPTLTITNVQATDVGDLECVLSNTCGGETSAIATLTLNNGSFCCNADVSGDDIVNIDDLLAVINFWGPCSGGCDADIAPPGGNGVVDIDDLLAVIGGWGACP